jgi:hypothetical protein
MSNLNSQTILIVIAAMVALALLLQGFALAVIAIGVRKAAGVFREQADELRTTVLPFCSEARQTLNRVGPRIEQTVEDMAALTHSLRAQTDDVKTVTAEIIRNARRQATRIDTMATTALDAADRAVAYTSDAIAKPMRQVSGVLAAVQAVVNALRSPNSTSSHPRA